MIQKRKLMLVLIIRLGNFASNDTSLLLFLFSVYAQWHEDDGRKDGREDNEQHLAMNRHYDLRSSFTETNTSVVVNDLN